MDQTRETPYGFSYDTAAWANDWNQAMSYNLYLAEKMVEVDTQSEKVLNIDGFFHTHDNKNMEKLDRFRRGIIFQLEESEGNVLIALEIANLTQEASEDVYQLIIEGSTLRTALKQVLKPLPGKTEGIVDYTNMSNATGKGDEASSNDILTQIQVLDTIITNPKYKGRVRVLLEGRPKPELEKDQQFVPIFEYSTQDLTDRTTFT